MKTIHLIPKWRPRARKRGDRGQNSAFFFDKRSCHLKPNNSKRLEIMLMDICMSFDILLGFYCKMYVVRSDDNNMAMSTVSSYGETDYNRSFDFLSKCQRIVVFRIALKKFRLKKEKRFLFMDFPKKKICWTCGFEQFEGILAHTSKKNKNTSVCSRHFKPEDFKETLSGRRILCDGAVPLKFDWKSASSKK